MRSNSRAALDLKRQARGWFHSWARSVAAGHPRPENVMILRAGAILGSPQPAELLDSLVEAVRQDPEIFAVDREVGRG